MIYREVCGERVSMLGFGTMRLPLLAGDNAAAIDEKTTAQMVRMAMENGVNYFDTAWPYHGGNSEIVIGRILSEYKRDTYFLADKYPGHQIAPTYDPKEIFEKQLKKCGVSYFDFYLLHNVYENDIDVYEDERWGIVPYFIEQKRRGRIRHLGFSTHGSPELIRRFLDKFGSYMEFCQIQFNYLDRTLQQAEEKYRILSERGIPVIVMEPLHGGDLAKLSPENEAKLKELRPDESIASWAFRYLQSFPGIGVVLSGMSRPEQMQDNLITFREERPLSKAEETALFAVASGMYENIPCTACRYCCEGCPKGLDIPFLLSVANELRAVPITNVAMRLDGLGEGKGADACIGCGKCAAVCPQKIEIPKLLHDLAMTKNSIKSWQEICEERAAAAKKLEENDQ